jgi:hypothetical protein
MDERPYLPTYDPDFCLKVARWGAATCVGWLTIAVLLLALVDPSNSRCPGWTIYTRNGQATSLWFFVGMFTALPTIWICFVVLRWKRFSQRVYDNAAGTYRGFPNLMPKVLYDRYNPDPFTFPYNPVFVVVIAVWSMFCTGPLWMMLSNCTNLSRYLGY